jgi:hypothetical protein
LLLLLLLFSADVISGCCCFPQASADQEDGGAEFFNFERETSLALSQEPDAEGESGARVTRLGKFSHIG